MPSPVAAQNSAIHFDPAQLADIQLPEAVSIWPLAPGWWLLLAVSLLLIVLLIYFLKRKPRQPLPTSRQLKSQSLQTLQAIKKTYAAQPADKQTAHNTLKQLSILLRRYALSLYQRDDVAALTDSEWLALLDKMSAQPDFSTKFAALLTQIPYQSSDTDIDPALLSELLSATEKLIRHSVKSFTASPQEKPHV